MEKGIKCPIHKFELLVKDKEGWCHLCSKWYNRGGLKMEEQKCFFCGHSINQHDFSHKSECREGNCDCDEFIFEKRKCSLCDIIVDRNELSELMLNPHIQLIDLCKEHFKYEVSPDSNRLKSVVSSGQQL